MQNKNKAIQQKEFRPIDWEEIYLRLKSFERMIEKQGTPSPEKKKKVLRDRAQQLAKKTIDIKAHGASIEVVQFILDNETYGIESSYVTEVYPLREFTSLPGTAPYILGILNVRGRLVSILDLKKYFNLPEQGLTDFNKIIIIKEGKIELGILADAIPGVYDVPLNELQPSLPTLTGIREDYLKGVTIDRTVILDAKKLFSDKNIIATDNAEK